LNAAELVSQDGFYASGAAVRRGWQFRAAALRARDLIANPAGMDSPYPMVTAGLGLFLDPPYWQPSVAEAVVADWGNVVIGLRQDVKMEVFNTGVLTDETGSIVLNLLQRDTSVIRATFRAGFLLARPATDTDTVGSPIAIVQPSTYGS
jgi:hypothetical protein